MIAKSILLALSLSIGSLSIGSLSIGSLSVGAGAAFQGRDLERLLPNPTSVLMHANELGLDADRVRELRLDLQASRRGLFAMRDDLDARRAALRSALSADRIDRALIEREFDSVLEVENAMKRQALRSRLDLLEALTPEQRATARTGASRAVEQRAILRARIEQIRRFGKRVRATGGEFQPLRERVRHVERLIRAGELENALDQSNRILDDFEK